MFTDCSLKHNTRSCGSTSYTNPNPNPSLTLEVRPRTIMMSKWAVGIVKTVVLLLQVLLSGLPEGLECGSCWQALSLQPELRLHGHQLPFLSLSRETRLQVCKGQYCRPHLTYITLASRWTCPLQLRQVLGEDTCKRSIELPRSFCLLQ